MKIFQNENPSLLQVEIINELMKDGDLVSPRGKLVKEIRPASVEYLNPLKRVTFMRGRRINPFFQIAESLWILSGRSDVAFLDLFNKNMVSFSDDGVYFNAPYGERMRSFGKNDAHGVIINPVDQLTDCYIALTADKDSRQAKITISDPHFDNTKYTVGEHGRDIACNLMLTFKIRNNKLHMCVFNRSNDVIWGMFGANLCQFSTIQEMLATWLGVEVGTYHQITDSMHMYLDDYASGGNKAIFDEHPGLEDGELDLFDFVDMPESIWWDFDTEPRMSLSKDMTEIFFEFFWSSIAPKLADDDFVKENTFELLNVLFTDSEYLNICDDYWRMAIAAMFAYRFIRLKDYTNAIDVLDKFVANSSWKVSMVYFLKTLIDKNLEKHSEEDANKIALRYNEMLDDMVASCTNPSEGDKIELQKYLDLEISKN